MAVLKRPLVAPANTDLFTAPYLDNPGIYPDGAAMVLGSLPALSQDAAREAVRAHFGDHGTLASRAVMVFDDPRAEALVEEPTIRAALALLTGTALEPTIEYFLESDRFSRLGYGEPTRETYIGESRRDGELMRLLISERYEGEDFRLIATTIGHEVLHDDPAVQDLEELVAHLLQYVAHLQILLRDPAISRLDTELARRFNSTALALLNSRANGVGEVDLLVTDNRLFPGSDFEQRSWWDVFVAWDFEDRISRDNPVSDPLRPVLLEMLSSITATATPFPAALGFDHDLVETINDNLDLSRAGLSNVELVRLLVLLESITVDDIVQELGVTFGEAVEQFDLQLILDTIDEAQ